MHNPPQNRRKDDATVFRKIDHVEIIPQHYEETIRFYTDILGFTIRSREHVGNPPLKEVIYLELNGTVVELLSVDNPQPLSEQGWRVGYRMLALEVANMDEALRALSDKGIQPSWGPVQLGPSKRAEIKDPNGLSIELRQW